MGYLDRRNSLKMRRRKAQMKKKARIKNRKAALAAQNAESPKKGRAAKQAAS